MDIDELKKAVYEADPAAVLVPPRILRRVLQAEFKVPYLLVQAPHQPCYFFDRQILYRHVEQDELDLPPDRLLPPTVVLLARPSPEELQALGADETLLRYWRLLFHVHVHLALHRRAEEGRLTPDDVRARVERLGRTEFEEIRAVLRQENTLLPPGDDRAVYVEFAAVYLELRYFRTNLRATYFPALRDFKVIDEMLAQDLDADALFAKTRLAGAPKPVVRTDTSSDESHDYYNRLMRNAERLGKEGDVVRAAIVRTKAARVAPAHLTETTRERAAGDLEKLTAKLQEVLKLSPEEVHDWLRVLPALLDKADQGQWPVEAKLLYDLQNACIEHERKLYALDLVEWVSSAGRRPIKRPLTSLQLVHTTRHLRSAARHLTMARISDDDRQQLARLFQSALHHSEELLRERFRPLLHGAFYDVGLTAASPPEQVALNKMVEELLDQIVERGFFSFSDLRDTVSRNQLKLPDLSDPHAFWKGDALLRLDRRLATLMEGVYRTGEFYLRWLESCSSLLFGTASGRFLTLNLLIPFAGTYALLRGVELSFMKKHVAAETLTAWGVGSVGLSAAPLGGGPLLAATTLPASQPVHAPFFPWYVYLLVAVFALALLHSARLRQLLADAGRKLYRGTRFAVVELPSRVWHTPWLQELLRSWPFLLAYWYLFKPLAASALLWWWAAPLFDPPWLKAASFLVLNLILNSYFGYAMGEVFLETGTLAYGWLRFEVLQGLFRWVSGLVRQVSKGVETLLYTVDEWLRFRSDEGRLTTAVRACLGVLWFPVGYVIRLYYLMLIEPSLHPLKLPIGIMAAKFFVLNYEYIQLMNPVSGLVTGSVVGGVEAYSNRVIAWLLYFAFIWPTVWLLPSVVAFFIWEMQENWRLYRANRAKVLRPVMVGRHGETILRLLKPGFHSGTIPRLFADLRQAEHEAYLTGNWRAARTHRQTLREVARSVQVFVEREFLVLLHQSKSWPTPAVKVGQVVLSCNRIRIELGHADFPKEPVWVTLEERSGWLIGGLQQPGWLHRLAPEALQVMSTAFAGFYRLAGVDFIGEQITAALAPRSARYDLTDRFLVLQPETRNGRAVTYDLHRREERIQARSPGGLGDYAAPALESRRVFFARVPLTWEQWVQCWRQDASGKGHPDLFGDGPAVLPLHRPDGGGN